ncbi:hypothetical protein EXIGLDRAFT_754175 [Exidia glandulosa HHB12029]|uniref:Uncharacterized protein n=1 Tax=Exidia glandulosa HHB12029 TaxID=1314781 RepID=A0A165D646_EXIGL|nr:hypothetical protein EXIGLDRAFT_754175 [Exidia glandulosa HHB12029]
MDATNQPSFPPSRRHWHPQPKSSPSTSAGAERRADVSSKPQRSCKHIPGSSSTAGVFSYAVGRSFSFLQRRPLASGRLGVVETLTRKPSSTSHDMFAIRFQVPTQCVKIDKIRNVKDDYPVDEVCKGAHRAQLSANSEPPPRVLRARDEDAKYRRNAPRRCSTLHTPSSTLPDNTREIPLRANTAQIILHLRAGVSRCICLYRLNRPFTSISSSTHRRARIPHAYTSAFGMDRESTARGRPESLPLDFGAVVTVSGDGLLHEVLNGFAKHATDHSSLLDVGRAGGTSRASFD